MKTIFHLLRLLLLSLIAAAGGLAGIASAAAWNGHHVNQAAICQAFGANGMAGLGIKVKSAVGIKLKPAGERNGCPVAQQEEQCP